MHLPSLIVGFVSGGLLLFIVTTILLAGKRSEP